MYRGEKFIGPSGEEFQFLQNLQHSNKAMVIRDSGSGKKDAIAMPRGYRQLELLALLKLGGEAVGILKNSHGKPFRSSTIKSLVAMKYIVRYSFNNVPCLCLNTLVSSGEGKTK